MIVVVKNMYIETKKGITIVIPFFLFNKLIILLLLLFVSIV
jgi:hypothetical protein